MKIVWAPISGDLGTIGLVWARQRTDWTASQMLKLRAHWGSEWNLGHDSTFKGETIWSKEEDIENDASRLENRDTAKKESPLPKG